MLNLFKAGGVSGATLVKHLDVFCCVTIGKRWNIRCTISFAFRCGCCSVGVNETEISTKNNITVTEQRIKHKNQIN